MAWELRQSSWNKYGDAYFDANLETYGVIFHYQHMKKEKENKMHLSTKYMLETSYL